MGVADGQWAIALECTPRLYHVKDLFLSAGAAVVSTGTVEDRMRRLEANPKRAAALAKARARLAKSVSAAGEAVPTLATLRLAAGYSQASAAAALNTRQPNIARLEKSPSNVTIETMRRLAKLYRVDLAAIVAAIDAAEPVEVVNG